MEPRIKNPMGHLPGALDAMHALHKSMVEQCGVPRTTLELTNLRASQINGCSVCVELHWRALRKLGEKDERISTVCAWRESPYYSDAERAALGLAEAATRLSDRPDPVPDDVWKEAARQFNEKQLAGLVVSIALINMANRFNVVTRQVGGPFLEQYVT